MKMEYLLWSFGDRTDEVLAAGSLDGDGEVCFELYERA